MYKSDKEYEQEKGIEKEGRGRNRVGKFGLRSFG
jgi:hypothetical protein